MHMLGDPRTMQADPRYDDVVAEVGAFLARAGRGGRRRSGVEEVWVDPGIGFGKTLEHNLALLARPRRAGRDRFPGGGRHLPQAVPRRSCSPRPTACRPVELVEVDDRLEGSVATATWAMWHGARMVRAHDVRATVLAARAVAEASIEERS